MNTHTLNITYLHRVKDAHDVQTIMWLTSTQAHVFLVLKQAAFVLSQTHLDKYTTWMEALLANQHVSSVIVISLRIKKNKCAYKGLKESIINQ